MEAAGGAEGHHDVGDVVEILKTERGKNLYVVGGFRFHFNKKCHGGTDSVTCVERAKERCNARLRIKDKKVVATFRAAHSHPPKPGKLAYVKVKNQLREMATASVPTHAIVAAAATSLALPQHEDASLPQLKSVERTVQRWKTAEKRKLEAPQPENTPAAVPKTIAELEDQSQFVILDEGEGEDRFLLLASEELLELLNEAEQCFSNGTVKMVPVPFQAAYSIAIDYKGHLITVVHFLCGRAHPTSDQFRRLFTSLANLAPNFSPSSWVCDFEIAAWQAIQEIWNITPTGCLFNLSQNIWRRLGTEDGNLQAKYKEDSHFRGWVDSLTALSLVPCQKVESVFKELAFSTDLPVELEGLYDYFQATYIGKCRFSRHVPARFPPADWNFYDGIISENGSRFHINNNIEEMHNSNHELLGARPGIKSFLLEAKRHLVSELQKKSGADLGELLPRRLGYQDVVDPICLLALDFHNQSPLDYLKAQAQNLGSKS